MNWLERFQWKLQEWCNWVRFFCVLLAFHKCRFMTHMLNIYSLFQWWYTEELRLDINQLVGTIPPGIGSLPNLHTYSFFYHALWIHRCCLLPYLATNLASCIFVAGELRLYNNSLTGSFACSDYNISVCLVSCKTVVDPTCGVLWWNDTCNLLLEACKHTCQSSF